MNEIQIIQSKIFEVSGRRVLLDSDLAQLYQVETRVLNQAVKRNVNRFPGDFMFRLTDEEWNTISSQFVMTSRTRRPKSARPLPTCVMRSTRFLRTRTTSTNQPVHNWMLSAMLWQNCKLETENRMLDAE